MTSAAPTTPTADPASTVITTIADRLGRDQVFGPPVERNGTILVPVAKVVTGGGGGAEPAGAAGGAGAGVLARPVGAFSLDADGKVRWHPAVDVTRIVAGGQAVVAVVAAVALTRMRRRRLTSR
jgi:uncharacterized spore protein YtfJ